MRNSTKLTTTLGIILALCSQARAAPGGDAPLAPYADAAAPDATAPDAADLRGAQATSDEPTVAAEPERPTRAFLRHIPPTEARAKLEVRLIAVIENSWLEDGLVARYRAVGATEYKEVNFERSSAGGYFASIPGRDVGRAGVEYYLVGHRGNSEHFASAEYPHRVRVEPNASDRWTEVEKRRLGHRRYALDTSLSMLDFGSSHGRDRYVQGNVDWSHLLVGDLYSIHLGFGFLQGQTPGGTSTDDGAQKAGVRFGYGGLRYRLRDKVWLDTKAMMGFGQDGFVVGVGGALTLGNDWRTAVTVGAEAMTELSYKAWLRLQWDTVPGVLMSATVATTNQPGAQIDAGSYVEFKVRYPVSQSLELAGTINYAARGNRPGGVGAGLHTRYMF